MHGHYNWRRGHLDRRRHLHPTSYPATNGLAERDVQTLKQGLLKMQGTSMEDNLSRFLFKYRLMPHSTTGVAPCELLMGRKLRSRLDLLTPNLTGRVQHRQEKQKENHDNGKPLREFQLQDTVYAENFTGSEPKWLEGIVVEVLGSRSYKVKLTNGVIVRRHIDSIRVRLPTDPPENETTDSEQDVELLIPTRTAPAPAPDPIVPPTNPSGSSGSTTPPDVTTTEPAQSTLRRSTRDRNPILRYHDIYT